MLGISVSITIIASKKKFFLTALTRLMSAEQLYGNFKDGKTSAQIGYELSHRTRKWQGLDSDILIPNIFFFFLI